MQYGISKKRSKVILRIQNSKKWDQIRKSYDAFDVNDQKCLETILQKEGLEIGDHFKDEINNKMSVIFEAIYASGLQLSKTFISDGLKDFIYKEYHGICGFCESAVDKRDFEIDHITPRVDDARLVYYYNNLQLLCSTCNGAGGKGVDECLSTRNKDHIGIISSIAFGSRKLGQKIIANLTTKTTLESFDLYTAKFCLLDKNLQQIIKKTEGVINQSIIKQKRRCYMRNIRDTDISRIADKIAKYKLYSSNVDDRGSIHEFVAMINYYF